jgi:hypothetical protein
MAQAKPSQVFLWSSHAYTDGHPFSGPLASQPTHLYACNESTLGRSRMTATSRHCGKCDQTRPASDFYRSSRNADGLQSPCIPCRRAYKKENRARLRAWRIEHEAANPEVYRDRRLRMAYGITAAQYDALSESQGRVCAICLRPPHEGGGVNGSPKALAVDHCHESGLIRGLLCTMCNTALGKFGDDAERVARAAEYLKAERTGEILFARRVHRKRQS